VLAICVMLETSNVAKFYHPRHRLLLWLCCSFAIGKTSLVHNRQRVGIIIHLVLRCLAL
jgi:hypothetical protein